MSCTSADYEMKTDVTKSYIDWAIDEGFQVIDVNIPKVVDFEDVGLSSREMLLHSSNEIVG